MQRPAPAQAEFALLFASITRRLGLRAEGYRRVRGTVEKRLRRRLSELGLSSFLEYEAYLQAHPGEWDWVEPRCRITISRFGRDRGVYERLVQEYLPERAAEARARGQGAVRVWSAGTASGEEALGVAIAWELELRGRYPGLGLEVLGTDADPVVLARAKRAVYPAGSLRELPESYRQRAFVPRAGEWAVLDRFRAHVRFVQADLREGSPQGRFDLVLCRNLAFTYFAEAAQRQAVAAITSVLAPAGVLVVGAGESVPEASPELELLEPCFYRRRGCAPPARAPELAPLGA
jgi:chemotaxis protein methyltransferase CheR